MFVIAIANGYDQHMQCFGRITLHAMVALAAGGLASVALAEDKTPDKKELPGVSAPEPIVKPRPDSAALSAASEYGDGFVKMGNWDVKISGYTRVDISAGNIRNNGR